MVEDFFIDLDYARTQVALLKNRYPLLKIHVPFFVSSVQLLEFKGLFTWRWEPKVGVLTRGVSPYLSCKSAQIKMKDYIYVRVTPPT